MVATLAGRASDGLIRRRPRAIWLRVRLNRYRHLAALGVVAALLAACSPLSVLNASVPADGYTVETDIAFDDGERQRLDLYLPTDPKSDGTVVVFFYGGSWKRGDREDYRFMGEAFASQGYVTVIPDYRLYPDVRFPAFVEDGAEAVRWVHRSIALHGGNPDRIVLVGHSAGAHIAALLALDRRYLRNVEVPATAIDGLIGLAGPYAFDPRRYRSTRPIFASAADPFDTRPINFVRPDAPPALLLHGQSDTVVRPSNSQSMALALQSSGVAVRYVPLPGTGHIRILLNFAAPFRDGESPLRQAVDFIEQLPADADSIQARSLGTD